MLLRFIPLVGLPLALAAAATSSFQPATQSLGFSLSGGWGGSGSISATFSRDGVHNDVWNSSFAPAELAGLDLAQFQAAGTRPLHFALNRESGTLDCSGIGGSSRATGRCGLMPRAEFAQALSAARVPSPSEGQWIELFAVNVHRGLIEALRAANYPVPTVDELVELSAVGVDAGYIRALSAAGYRPPSLDSLTELRAVGVTPDWIGSLARVGYASLPIDQLAELRSLGVDANYIRSFQQAGYGRLSADELVELKALGVTAEFARKMERNLGRQSPQRLVELKALGFAERE